jgi:hypothetical protein
MKVKLNKRELFWCLINPQDIEEILIVLNESNPEVDIDFDKLPKWAKDQISSSAKLDKISTEPDLKAIPTATAVAVEKKEPAKVSVPRKKVAKKVTAKALE